MVDSSNNDIINRLLKENCEPGSIICSDGSKSYNELEDIPKCHLKDKSFVYSECKNLKRI